MSEKLTLDDVKHTLTEEHISDMDNMSDKDLINVWKIHSSKAKRLKKSKNKDEYNYAYCVSLYSMYLHKQIQAKAEKEKLATLNNKEED